MWDYDRLAKEWDARRVQVLRMDYNESLEAAIELSLASLTFCELGPGAREILGTITFFPQGINENSLDWLFPAISSRRNVLDKFCMLSLTYRSNGFVTMLAPLRDYLSPKHPASSSLLRATKDHYFSRLSILINPGQPGFEEARWIALEDVNVEHMFNVFTSIDADSVGTWDACASFMRHLNWHKIRLVALGPKIEGLPDDHHSKPGCLFQLSLLFQHVGNRVEQKRLLVNALKLWRERRNDFEVAETLRFLSGANRRLGLYSEGKSQTKEVFEIYERFNHIPGQARSFQEFAMLLYADKQVDAAEEAAL